MLITDIIDRLDQLVTNGISISDWKHHAIDARDQAARFDKALEEALARNETLQITLDAERLRNAALAQSTKELIAANEQLIETHAKEKEEIETHHRQVIAGMHTMYSKPAPPGVPCPWS